MHFSGVVGIQYEILKYSGKVILPLRCKTGANCSLQNAQHEHFSQIAK